MGYKSIFQAQSSQKGGQIAMLWSDNKKVLKRNFIVEFCSHRGSLPAPALSCAPVPSPFSLREPQVTREPKFAFLSRTRPQLFMFSILNCSVTDFSLFMPRVCWYAHIFISWISTNTFFKLQFSTSALSGSAYIKHIKLLQVYHILCPINLHLVLIACLYAFFRYHNFVRNYELRISSINILHIL